jgi:hypothetical protein
MSKNSKASDLPRHRRSAPSGGRSNGYAVGYRKPPLHTRFRPGQSGNPAGRPKAVRNLSTDVRRTLKTPVKLTEGRRPRKISTQEGALLVLREKALKGDARALDRLLELASRYNNDAGDTITQQLSADDQAILAAYVAEFAPAAVTSTPAELARRPRVELRRKFRSSPNEESSE